jgi:hypothetical protein
MLSVSAFLGLILAICGNGYGGDSVSYLDLGDAFFSGDRQAIFNGLWSPLYPFLLGLTRWLLKPSMHWESLVVQLTNWVIFLAAILSFQYFWGEVLHLYRHLSNNQTSHCTTFSDAQFWMLGYVIFLFMHLNFLTDVTPDMLLSAFVYLASGLILRMVLRGPTIRRFCVLGLTLGFGFLAKAIMLPLAGVFILVAALSNRRRKFVIGYACASVLVFSVVAAPYVFELSKKEGHFTAGDAGLLNYAWHINGAPFVHWRGEIPGLGKPVHPTRLICTSPSVFEFGEPITATYSPWYDPVYWNAGLHPQFDWAAQTMAIKESLSQYLRAFWSQSVLIAGVLVLLAMRQPFRAAFVEFLAVSYLWVPAFVAFFIYGVLWVEGRYVTQFFVLFWAAALTLVRLPDGEDSRRLIRGVVIVMVVLMGIRVSVNLVTYGVRGRDQSLLQTQLAERLAASGVRPRDEVATVGAELGEGWQKLTRVRVVSEVAPGEEGTFWSADDATRRHVCELLARTGATVLIASRVPEWAPTTGWDRVDNTSLYLFRLNCHFGQKSIRLPEDDDAWGFCRRNEDENVLPRQGAQLADH